jgi:hypothetical protein
MLKTLLAFICLTVSFSASAAPIDYTLSYASGTQSLEGHFTGGPQVTANGTPYFRIEQEGLSLSLDSSLEIRSCNASDSNIPGIGLADGCISSMQGGVNSRLWIKQVFCLPVCVTDPGLPSMLPPSGLGGVNLYLDTHLFSPLAGESSLLSWSATLIGGGISIAVSGVALATPSPVPLPAAAWLFISAIAGLVGAKRLSRSKSTA